MSWFRLDDGFHSHPKVIAAGNAAIGLFARCGTYCAQHLTDGFVPTQVALMYGNKRLLDRLVTAGLMTEEPDGWRLHDYLHRNPSRAQVDAEREATAERVRKWRETRSTNTVGNTASNGARNTVRNGGRNTAPTRPDPTRTTRTPAAVAAVHSATTTNGHPPPIDEPAPPDPVEPRTAAEKLLADHGPWPASIRRALHAQLNECLDAGLTEQACAAGLAEWKTRERAMPGLLPHLVRDAAAARVATAADPDAEWFHP